ncbi:MAG: DNRLRE domain-containing protein [Ruminococcaceae bacterium]|nr:DNRLRE domain-containing protein [Oscillospiraceae bacterium]
MKEDILLVREGNVNAFSFILNTDGLIPAEDAGGWYLWDGIDVSQQIRLGQVISYDANGDFSIGEMTVTPNGGTTYRITLAVDPTFLEDATYPVTVDPTFTVSDNENGANAIEDIVLFEGAPDACYRSMQYNTVGASSLGTGKTAFRLKGFQNSAAYASAFEFTNVKFRVYDYSSVAQEVGLYPLANANWQENTATWNNIGMYYDPYQCFATIPVGGWGEFNITELANQWLEGDHNINAGFILISKNNTVAKKIYSSENTANTARRPYVEATYIYDPLVIYDDTMYKNESQTINLYITSHVNAVTWSVSDSSVISITSSGTMTTLATAAVHANKLGSSEITATLTLSDGTTASITKTIYVVLENGVYAIFNQYLVDNFNTNYYLSPDAVTSTDITARTAKDTLPETLKENWWIEHLQDGEYVFRNMENVSNVLSIQGAQNDTFSAVLTTIEGEVPDNAKWYIRGGHLISKVVPEKALILEYGLEKPGIGCYYYDLEFSVPQNITFEFWKFTKLNKAGIAFRKVSTGKLTKAPTVTTKIGPPITIAELGFTAVAYGEEPALTDVQWSSSDTSVATVHSSTGEITMLAPGKVKIFAETTINGTEYTDFILITIQGLPSGNYYMRNVGAENFIQIDNSVMKYESLTDMESAIWTITYSPIGYYTIRIGNKYLSVVNETVKVVTVTSTSVTNDQLFRIEIVSNGQNNYFTNCILLPKSTEEQNLALLSLAQSSGNTITLGNHQTHSAYRQWSMIADNMNQDVLEEDNKLHVIQVNALYDTKYNDMVDTAFDRITDHLKNATAYYLSNFGLYFKFSLNENPIDLFGDDISCIGNTCNHEGVTTEGNIIENVTCHCRDRYIADTLNRDYNTTAGLVMLFTGHDLCSINDDNEHYTIGGLQRETALLVKKASFDYECSTVIHELGHLYGTPDHYEVNGHYTTDEVNTEGNDYYISEGMYNEYCIYGENKTSAEENGDVMCAGCQYWLTVNRAKFDD